MADQKSWGEGLPKDSEEVLIEREGKFELVSAADMQANTPTTITDIIDDPRPELSSPLASEVSNKNQKKTFNDGKGSQRDEEITSVSDKRNSPSVSSVLTRDSQAPIKKSTEKITYDTDTTAEDTNPLNTTGSGKLYQKSNETVEKSTSEGYAPSAASGTNIAQTTTSTSTSSGGTTTTATSSTATSSRDRTTSAPELRMTSRRRRIEEEIEKKKRNEAAYNAWLSRKNVQIAEQKRLDRANNRPVSREEMEQKREMCENAYKAWLEGKRREVAQRRFHERAIKSATVGTQDHDLNSTAFQKWLEQKQLQRQKEQEIGIRKTREEEEIAVKVDPDTANKAYKRWLHQKNIQAREAAARRLELQRFYFRQGKRLKESLKARFQGY